MLAPRWQLTTPLDTIIFDCDGTLSMIEGIDVLAEYNGVESIVKSLTAEAMGISGINPELYQKRLELVQPTQDQIYTLGQYYFEKRSVDLVPVIELFQRLNKKIYIISAGLRPAIAIFANLLGISNENIFAVDISFDANGNFLHYDQHSPLLHQSGKQEIISGLQGQILYVGDGLNDHLASKVVTRFVGYGGVFYRENIAFLCQYYIKSPSLAPLVNLALTENERGMLSSPDKELYNKGMNIIQNQEVLIKGSSL